MSARVGYESPGGRRDRTPWDLLVRPVAGGVELDDGDRVVALTLADAQRLAQYLARAIAVVEQSEKETGAYRPIARGRGEPTEHATAAAIAIDVHKMTALRLARVFRADQRVVAVMPMGAVARGSRGTVARTMERPTGVCLVRWDGGSEPIACAVDNLEPMLIRLTHLKGEHPWE